VSGSAVGNTVYAVSMSINVAGSSQTINIVQLDPKSGSYRPAASVACTVRGIFGCFCNRFDWIHA
jgi:hypothetical protein